MLPLLSLALAAAPVLPKESFPELSDFPIELDGQEPSGERLDDEHAADFIMQVVPGHAGLETLKKLGATREDLLKVLATPEVRSAFTPAGRVKLGKCQAWFAHWEQWWDEGGHLDLIVFTTTSSGALVDARVLSSATPRLGWPSGTPGSFETTSSVTVAASGSIGVESVENDLAQAPHADLPRCVVQSRERASYRLTPACALAATAPPLEPLTGDAFDLDTGEELSLADDGKTVEARYRANSDASWQSLAVSDVDRKNARLTVAFKRMKERYPLAWGAGHAALTSTSPDGGIQRFLVRCTR